MQVKSVEHDLFLEAFAQRKAPLTLILGSGLSAPAGLPTWPALERKLREAVAQRVAASNAFGQHFNAGPIGALRATKDPWLAFKHIKEILGPPVFESLVESQLSPAANVDTPPGYIELLKLQPHGVITLNLDRFAGDAMSSYRTGLVTPVYGLEIADKWNVLLDEKPHLVYLHGDILNPSTWVLTQDDLQKLINSKGHALFLQSVFMNNIVLFAGVGADDAALSMRLIDLRNAGLKPKNLFWLTSRLDSGLQDWADQNYVKLIRYQATSNKDHLSFLQQFVESCLEFMPPEPQFAPVVNDRFEQFERIEPEDLARQSPEYIRKYLASSLSDLIKSTDEESIYEQFRLFCEEYNFPLHQAFYRSKAPGFDTWFGYQLNFPSTGRGNFGEVYHATGPGDQTYAVKIMNEGAFVSDEMLGGFRRGVSSMRIINESQLDGMVRMIEAFEIPPTIVMPYVYGLSLQSALEQRPDLSWATKLAIGSKIASIVLSAHALPATVLHRDLKPSNIMIQNFEYVGEFEPEVTVLDFDMSWHKGSTEKDVIFESRDDFGFLCPEQTDPANPYNARNTRVDSYGLGMTLYFMFGLEAPLANEPLSSFWAQKVLRAASRNYNFAWSSAPKRLARLILRATRIEQPDRIDFASMGRELAALQEAIKSPDGLENIEFWAEEIMDHIGSSIPYEWDDARGTGRLNSPSGVSVAISTDPKELIARCEFTYTEAGASNRTNVPRFLKQNVDSAVHLLTNGGWSKVRGEVLMGGLLVTAEVSLENLKRKRDLIDVPRSVYKLLMP